MNFVNSGYYKMFTLQDPSCKFERNQKRSEQCDDEVNQQ